MSLLGFWMGTMLANFYMCSIMLVLRAVFNMFARNASPRGPMCFSYLIFNLSGPCELLFLLCFIASWTWFVVSIMLYPFILCVALLMDLFVLCDASLWIVWWNNSPYVWVWLAFCCWTLRMCLVWVEMFCACCSCDPSVHLTVPSIGFVYVFVCRCKESVCGRERACNCCVSCPLVCCACLPSVWCV